MPINSVTIVGNLTRDPELRGLPSGGSVCSLRVAVNERRKNNQTGQWDDVPNFFNVTVFGNSAEACKNFLAKGRQVAVDGRLRWREYQDKDGNRREAIEIVAQDVQFIGGREGGPGGGGGQGGGYGGGQQDDWGGGGGGQQGGGGFNGPGTSYPVDQGDFGGGGQQGGGGGGGWNNEPPRQAPAPAPTPAPADDDIPF